MNPADHLALLQHEHAFNAERARLTEEETRVNGDVYISPWSPRTTLLFSSRRTYRIECQLAHWSEAWWKAKGYRVERGMDGAVLVYPTEVKA